MTGIYGESNCGGFFGAELRFAGYDGLIVKGRSSSPVYLGVGEDGSEIRPRQGSWHVARAEEFRDAVRRSTKGLREALVSQVFRDFGTAPVVDPGIAFGSMPNKYYTQGAFPQATNLSGVTMAETILEGSGGCFGCPIRCKPVVHVKEGKHARAAGEGPGYEAVVAWGPCC